MLSSLEFKQLCDVSFNKIFTQEPFGGSGDLLVAQVRRMLEVELPKIHPVREYEGVPRQLVREFEGLGRAIVSKLEFHLS